MPLPPAKIQNPSAKESWQLRLWQLAQAYAAFLWHLAQAFAALPPVFVALSWLFAAVGCALALVVPVLFWIRGDILSVVLFGLPTPFAIYEIIKLPRRKSVNLPSKLFWSLLLSPPFLGLLLYRIGYRRPDSHRSHHEHDGNFPHAGY